MSSPQPTLANCRRCATSHLSCTVRVMVSTLPSETTCLIAAILTSASWNSGGEVSKELPAECEACVLACGEGLRRGLPAWFIFKGECWECVERLRSWESSLRSGLGFTSLGHCRGFGVKSWGAGKDFVFRQQHKQGRILFSTCMCVCVRGAREST